MGKPSKEKNQPISGRGRGRGGARGRGTGRGGASAGGGRSARSTFGPADASMYGAKPDSLPSPADEEGEEDSSSEAGKLSLASTMLRN
jgi:hypothetical protein